jgi:hypothetical protein
MKIDWTSVKKQTLGSYEDLIEKLLEVLAYNFVQEHYDHTMKQAQAYAKKIRRGYLQNRGDKTAKIDNMIANLRKLGALRIGTYSKLIYHVATREQCIAFLRRTDFDFDQLIQTLNYLLRWVLPFKAPIREFIDAGSVIDARYLEVLREQRIRSNLDLLEAGRARAGRVQLSNTTGIPLAFLTSLVHKADISRLAYVRGKTVKHLSRGGYDTVDKIATANLAEMEEKMDAYYGTLGKRLADFKLVIPLSWVIGGAQILPRVVKV